jgi:positive regulator of sigma E activity
VASDPLTFTHPDLAAEWHPKKNGVLRPDCVTRSYAKTVWWRCRANQAHEWQATAMQRVYGTPACPRCEKGTVADYFPELVREWHPELNGELRPDNIARASTERVWWLCPQDPEHVWQTTVKSRASRGKSTGCPFCDGQRTCTSNSLGELRPELIPMWHKTKNGKLTPFDVSPTVQKRVWWKCLFHKDHVWEGPVNSVAKSVADSRGCPFCAGKQVCYRDSLEVLHPEIASEWHIERNKPVRPKDVLPGSSQRAWWKCKASREHVWEAEVSTRLRSGCPFCTGRAVCPTNSLASLYPDVALSFHPTKNKKKTAHDYTAHAAAKVWWQCQVNSKHVWEAAIYSVVDSPAGGCPYCAGKRVTKETCLMTRFPLVAQQWHPSLNEGLTAYDVLPHSDKIVWWKCFEGHTWETTVHHMVEAREANLTNGCKECYLAQKQARTLQGRVQADQRIKKREREASLDDEAARPDKSVIRE